MRHRTLTAAAAAAALTLTLAGCLPSLPNLPIGPGSGGPGSSGQGSEGSGGSGPVGGVELPSASLPADWPAELPLPEGRLVTSTSSDGAQSLIYLVADAGVAERLVEDVVALGFELESTTDMGALVSNMLSRDDWNVTIGWLVGDDGVTLTYVSGSH